MREILFRGKKTEYGGWVDGYLIYDEFCNTHIPYIGYLDWDEHNVDAVLPETVGQYTGLTDRNGKKIFEGDIVKMFYTDFEEIGIIRYSESNCSFVFAESQGDIYGFNNTDTMEVIGNIHDNTELLKGV